MSDAFLFGMTEHTYGDTYEGECCNCGETRILTDRGGDGGGDMCAACWIAALEHGHAHGMHTDEFGEPEAVTGCPRCTHT